MMPLTKTKLLKNRPRFPWSALYIIFSILSHLSFYPNTGKQLPGGVWRRPHPTIHDYRQAGGKGR